MGDAVVVRSKPEAIDVNSPNEPAHAIALVIRKLQSTSRDEIPRKRLHVYYMQQQQQQQL